MTLRHGRTRRAYGVTHPSSISCPLTGPLPTPDAPGDVAIAGVRQALVDDGAPVAHRERPVGWVVGAGEPPVGGHSDAGGVSCARRRREHFGLPALRSRRRAPRRGYGSNPATMRSRSGRTRCPRFTGLSLPPHSGSAPSFAGARECTSGKIAAPRRGRPRFPAGHPTRHSDPSSPLRGAWKSISIPGIRKRKMPGVRSSGDPRSVQNSRKGQPRVPTKNLAKIVAHPDQPRHETRDVMNVPTCAPHCSERCHVGASWCTPLPSGGGLCDLLDFVRRCDPS